MREAFLVGGPADGRTYAIPDEDHVTRPIRAAKPRPVDWSRMDDQAYAMEPAYDVVTYSVRRIKSSGHIAHTPGGAVIFDYDEPEKKEVKE